MGAISPFLYSSKSLRVREWQAFARLLEDLQREFRGRFAPGMEMPLQWRRRLRLRLRVCRTIVQIAFPATAKAVPTAGRVCMNSRRVAIVVSTSPVSAKPIGRIWLPGC